MYTDCVCTAFIIHIPYTAQIECLYRHLAIYKLKMAVEKPLCTSYTYKM